MSREQNINQLFPVLKKTGSSPTKNDIIIPPLIESLIELLVVQTIAEQDQKEEGLYSS